MDPTVIITTSNVISTVIWGLVIGCVYILLATGLNVIFGVMKLVNFAHGQLLMIGAFIAWTFVFATGLNVYVGLIVSMITVAALGILIEKFTFRKVLGTDKLNEIFVSLGLIII